MDNIQDLISFIRSQINGDDMLIEEYSLLESDLGITGEEAYELIISFGKTFKVNIDNFNFSEYFNEEPSAFSNTSSNVSPIRVKDLLKAIKLGKLDDDIFLD